MLSNGVTLFHLMRHNSRTPDKPHATKRVTDHKQKEASMTRQYIAGMSIMMSCLIIACQTGRKPLHNGAFQTPGQYDANAFVLGAKNGDKDKVHHFLENQIDLNVQGSDGETALGWAVYNGHTDIAQTLLDAGANPNAKNQAGNTPLIYAAVKGDMVLVYLLLDHGANIHVQGHNNLTPLMVAAREGHEDIVQILLNKGTVTNSQSTQGHTAMKLAKSKGHFDIVHLLEQNNQNRTTH